MEVLIIDDEKMIAQSISDYLEDSDIETRVAYDGGEGYASLLEKTPDIVIADLNMPVMNGYEFIAKAAEAFPDLPVVVISGVGRVSEAIQAIRAGAWDFISKPVTDMEVVLYTLEKNMEKAKLISDNKRYQENLEELVKIRTRQLDIVKKQVIACLGKASEFKDTETGLHVQRVGEISRLLAEKMGLEHNFCSLIRDAATMHDVGKIGIPDAVLLKSGPLDNDEWAAIKEHSLLGCKILSPYYEGLTGKICTPEYLLARHGNDDLMLVAKRIALFHHEKWDGKGYPYGLKGDTIPVEARITAIADVYDALSSDRPYKKAFCIEECLAIMRDERGTHFDPEIIDLFFENIEAIIDIESRLKDWSF